MIDPSIPFCSTCKHHHHQGSKCGICGHVGRNTIFKKMHEKAAAMSQFRISSFGSGLPNGCDFGGNSHDQWVILRELRANLCGGGDNLTTEFNMIDESNSRHILGWVGNRPILAVRYSLQFKDMHSATCILSRFGIYSTYTERPGVGQQCVEAFLNDLLISVNQIRQANGISIADLLHLSLSLIIPEIFVGVITTLIESGRFRLSGAVDMNGTQHVCLDQNK
jgi:hypothetical protein